jgi:hypothetical protein
VIPLCEPAFGGVCGCGRQHVERAVGKAPLVAWERYAVTPPTRKDLARWAHAWPRANAGVLLEPARLLIIDCDSAAALVEARTLGLPPAPLARTAHGEHRYYTAHAGVAGRTTRRGDSRAIDVLAAGYVVVPASVHRSGERYEWIVPPEATRLQPAPGWAVAMLRDVGRAAKSKFTALGKVGGPPSPGELRVSSRIRDLIRNGASPRYPSRSEALFAVLQALIRAGYADTTIANIVLAAEFGISAKPRDLGRRWLAHEIARARAKCPALVIA